MQPQSRRQKTPRYKRHRRCCKVTPISALSSEMATMPSMKTYCHTNTREVTLVTSFTFVTFVHWLISHVLRRPDTCYLCTKLAACISTLQVEVIYKDMAELLRQKTRDPDIVFKEIRQLFDNVLGSTDVKETLPRIVSIFGNTILHIVTLITRILAFEPPEAVTMSLTIGVMLEHIQNIVIPVMQNKECAHISPTPLCKTPSPVQFFNSK